MKIKILTCLLIALSACSQNETLPILGNRYAETKIVDGKQVVDTIYQSVPDFSFLNQDGDSVTQHSIEGKIYIADFFFTSCPTICPLMKKQMIRVYEAYKGDAEIAILSHTIDPEHDSVSVLKDYATRLGSDGKQWQFLTGKRETIYALAETGYYASAVADSTEPGGFVHSGGFILVDKQRRVRGIYDGTSEEDTDRLIRDIVRLKKEYDTQ